MSNVLTSNSISAPQIIVVVDEVRTSSPEIFGIFSGWQWEFLRTKFLRAGFELTNIKFKLLKHYLMDENNNKSLIVGMGEETLRKFTGKKGIDKWNMSPLQSLSGSKFIPTYDIGRIQKQWELGLYLELALKKAYEEAKSENYASIAERFLLNPSFEETMEVLKRISKEPEISVDIETGYGQINTVGFAWSSNDAIAINVLPGRCGAEAYYNLWGEIKNVMHSPAKKIFQNFIYDTSYFSAYGIRTVNIVHDTMWAMKLLWPELDMNLGNVGRIYTKRSYWKDDGRIESEEGKKKDWGNVRDWIKHYTYNCRDTTGTFEAKRNQVIDLKQRGLYEIFNKYLIQLTKPILEMCSNGMPISLEIREKISADTKERLRFLEQKLTEETGINLNVNSPKQLMSYLKSQGVKLSKKYDKTKGVYRESTDSSALKKIRLKHHDLKSLEIIADIKSLNTALSRYIDFEVKPNESKLRYSLIGTGTETLRFSGGKDPWGRGFNIQTIPREGGNVSIKSMFVAPGGNHLVEIDLKQAESRFVAYDSADPTLIEMLESGADVHKYVAAEIFKAPLKDITKDQRQLGKKAGHGANYAMKEAVFVETCFAEMDLILTREQAKNTLESYHRLFPGIRRWHAGIRSELNLKRKLTAPSGWERYFYGRFDDNMFKEAYAWRPQHTIPWITNHLMLHLCEERKKGNIKFNLIVQVHDSLILTVPDEHIKNLIVICSDLKSWHPRVTLSGGEMWIPVEIKIGKVMSELREIA